MPKIYIDGKEYDALQGQTIIQIADGINCGGNRQTDIPRFCYHESLSVAGNCRMCLVEFGMPKVDKETKAPILNDKGEVDVQWTPKLTTACSTQIMDGMRVRTHKTSNIVKDAQKGVLEFILINHPLDCPTCDQAGECPLQQTTYQYGPSHSRYEFEKNHKPKREKWGTKITFDAERCINCTRCVRFFDEYTKTHELEIVQRGWNNYPAPAPDTNMDANPYAMNVIDLCPVGALTSADYRFKSRVWEMSGTETISVNNGKCANITLWVRDNKVMRITPRYNPQVNGFFIADDDRLNYKWINENRASGARIAGNPAPWEQAFAEAARQLKSYQPNEIFVLASTKSSLETMYILKKFAADVLETTNIDYASYKQDKSDDKLISPDATPNTTGAEILGLSSKQGVTVETLADAIRSGKIKCVIAVEDDITNVVPSDALSKLETYIALPYHNVESNAKASVVLPAATFAEMIGVYINVDGVAQLAVPAKALRHQNREIVREMALSRLDVHATEFDRWSKNDNKVDAYPAWEILSNLSAVITGGEMLHESARVVFEEIAGTIPAFAGLAYKEMRKKGVKLEQVAV